MIRVLIIGAFTLFVFFVVSETAKDDQAFSPWISVVDSPGLSAVEFTNIKRMVDEADRRSAEQIPVSSGWAFRYKGPPCDEPPPVAPLFDPNIAIYMRGPK